MQTETTVNTKQSVPDDSWLFLAGPGCILCTLAVAVSSHQKELFYWLSISLIGIVCCTRYKMRGCIYAVLGVVFSAIIRHGWFLDTHLWNIGIETSLICGFFILALSMDHRQSVEQSLRDISAAQLSTIGHLEQNVAALMSSSQAQQVALQEKMGELQKELEETQSELSSIVILNEVLRKTSSDHKKEFLELSEALLDRDRRIGSLMAERESLGEQLKRLRSESALIQENERLLEALQAKRIDEEQVECILESLAHLQEKLANQEESIRLEKQRLQEDIAKTKEESHVLQAHVQQLSEELAQSLTCLQKSEHWEKEKEALEDRLQMAEMEMITLTKKNKEYALARETSARQVEKESLQKTLTDAQSKLALFEERLQKASQIEALYKQLREQFDEKNIALQEARSELFRVDTELQRLQIEKAQKELEANPFSPELEEEMTHLEKNIRALEEENGQLQQIVSHIIKGQSLSS